MSIKVSLNHKTHYQFDRNVSLSPHVVRLKPAPHTRIPIEAYSLNIEPKNYFINWQQDPFGNHIARLVFPEKASSLLIEVDLIAKLTMINPFDFFLDDYAKFYPFDYPYPLKDELQVYLKTNSKGSLYDAWLNEVDMPSLPIIDYLSRLNQLVHDRINYVIRLEPGVQSCEDTLQKGFGACRDLAWLLLETLRRKGLAARFVSGYLIQLKTGGYLIEEGTELAHDMTDLHAWVEAFIPGAGWIGMDPTSGFFASEGHIPLCCTPDPVSAAPIVGCTDVCEVKFEFNMSIAHLDPILPITIADPYIPEVWNAIDQLGKKVDAELNESQVNLTMGGEPTFVAIDNQDNLEWSVAALGDHKHSIGCDFIKRLMVRFAKGGVVLHGQGKWYSGEALPRWTLSSYWRKDRKPLWNDLSLLADLPHEGGFTLETAKQFVTLLAKELKGDPGNILSASDEEQWNQVLGSSAPVVSLGYVLPLEYNKAACKLQCHRWEIERKHLYLTPGTSPMGYRLPLNQIKVADDPKSFPTGLCVELRHNSICVFIPPIENLEAYCSLLAIIERIAKKLNCPILIEGYPPPSDPELCHFQITPDPGVIEVNVFPAENWEELKDIMLSVYEEAKKVRLTTEKYLIDGRRVGAGGGHHIIIGGPTVEQSPILVRPDMLQSFLTFWQNHPCLSYFFAGLFVGPTSQAPRIDEARHEALYELEIAFSQLSSIGDKQFAQIDRIFRNLLVDSSGNTHRTEISVDKLYDPHSPYGRQGLIELRCFEMQPHPHLSLLQLLLVRVLVAYFWKNPYKQGLIRWGTELHDRMMLPHFLWQDLSDVILELNDAGYPFDINWFRPIFEFRFPKYGCAQFDNIHLELRMALEPWHVLGEENVNSQTARTVDSSTERLQVKVTGLIHDRHLITCNKRRLPLHSSGMKGEYFAGVRFKSWNPPLTLHPNIPVHVPLVFDIYDTWLKRSIGGCTYYSTHPGGVNYAHLPLNAKDAEARRVSRFEVFGHSPDLFYPKMERPNNEYPYTLDLRRQG